MSNTDTPNSGNSLAVAGGMLASAGAALSRHRRSILPVIAAALGTYVLYSHPPVATLERGSIGVRINQFSGAAEAIGEGTVVVVPGVHELRRYSLREQVYRPVEAALAEGSAPFQSVEGLSIGLDVSVRYALDPARIAALAQTQPDDIAGQVVEPAVQSVLYKTLARYTVREIFSTKRQEIRETLEAELKALLAQDGIVLKQVLVGKVDLPADYRAGMEKLLAEELASEKMRYTLELKEKQVKESELEALAEKARRETAAAAAGEEQIIAAKAQAEAMKHVLPFKQKQIEQRGLEAEAEKVARIKGAQADAEARQIEAQGEAESRRKLADAEVYRQERLGQVASDQLARDGALIQKNPLLIQKALADKLSDKVSVIIAPPPTDGGFIGANLVGRIPAASPESAATAAVAQGE